MRYAVVVGALCLVAAGAVAQVLPAPDGGVWMAPPKMPGIGDSVSYGYCQWKPQNTPNIEVTVTIHDPNCEGAKFKAIANDQGFPVVPCECPAI